MYGYKNSKGEVHISPDLVLLDEANYTSSYEMCRDSGALDFWDDPQEDIYTFADGREL